MSLTINLFHFSFFLKNVYEPICNNITLSLSSMLSNVEKGEELNDGRKQAVTRWRYHVYHALRGYCLFVFVMFFLFIVMCFIIINKK